MAKVWSRLSLLTLLFLLAVMLNSPFVCAAQQNITVILDGHELGFDVLPLQKDGHVLVPVCALGEALKVQVDWEPVTNEVTVSRGNKTIKMMADSREAFLNGDKIYMDVPAQLVQNNLLVPLRFVVQTLGFNVLWIDEDKAVIITMARKEPVPDKISQLSLPAKAAFTNNNHLWLLNLNYYYTMPLEVTREGSVEILGWSCDGQWLMYLHRASEDNYSTKPYLWVVGANGTDARQVDIKPVEGKPAWSPAANIIAYSTQGTSEEYSLDGNLKIAVIEKANGQKSSWTVSVNNLLAENSNVFDFAWSPDGQNLAVSFPRKRDKPLSIDRISLIGERTNLLTLGEAGAVEDIVYPWAATELKWSPNGRYLAYYLRPNSGSLSADGVSIQVSDLKNSGKSFELGGGLQYSEWLAWSPDSTRLAYIEGGGREATVNKHLYIADMTNGCKLTTCEQSGQVDSQPVWMLNLPGTRSLPLKDKQDYLLFCRGDHSDSWLGKEQSSVLVPGQSIWLAAEGAKPQVLTNGNASTADYLPQVSPDGQSLIFLRLNQYNSASLYYKSLIDGKETELVRNITGEPGFYGNYYPAWVSIYWKEAGGSLPEKTGGETKENEDGQAELTEIFDNYNDRYDGAYAEGYSYELGRLYNASDKKLFIKELSKYPLSVVDGVAYLLTTELYFGDRTEVTTVLEKLTIDKSLTSNESSTASKILTQFKMLIQKNL